MELTIPAYREKIVSLLELAELEVRKLRDQLSLLDTIVQGEMEKHSASNCSSSSTVCSDKRITPPPDDANIGKVIRNAFLEKSPVDTFTVTSIVALVHPCFQNLDSDNLSKRVSGIARRLEKSGKIKIIEKGSGRKPHTYQLVSTVGNPVEVIDD